LKGGLQTECHCVSFCIEVKSSHHYRDAGLFRNTAPHSYQSLDCVHVMRYSQSLPSFRLL